MTDARTLLEDAVNTELAALDAIGRARLYLKLHADGMDLTRAGFLIANHQNVDEATRDALRYWVLYHRYDVRLATAKQLDATTNRNAFGAWCKWCNDAEPSALPVLRKSLSVLTWLPPRRP